MKKLFLSFTLIAISFIANCQNVDKVQAMITGHKMNDTIKIADFLKLSEISLNNKEYSIVSFRQSFKDGNLYESHDSNSNKITDEMKNGLSKMKNKDPEIMKIYIENINVQKSKGKAINISPLIFNIETK